MMISRSPTSQEHYVFMRNDTRVQAVSLGIVILHLNIDFFFWQNAAFIPSIRINLILVPILVIVFFWNWKSQFISRLFIDW